MAAMPEATISNSLKKCSRLLATASSKTPKDYKVGEKVEAVFEDDGGWYLAEVAFRQQACVRHPKPSNLNRGVRIWPGPEFRNVENSQVLLSVTWMGVQLLLCTFCRKPSTLSPKKLNSPNLRAASLFICFFTPN